MSYYPEPCDDLDYQIRKTIWEDAQFWICESNTEDIFICDTAEGREVFLYNGAIAWHSGSVEDYENIRARCDEVCAYSAIKMLDKLIAYASKNNDFNNLKVLCGLRDCIYLYFPMTKEERSITAWVEKRLTARGLGYGLHIWFTDELYDDGSKYRCVRFDITVPSPKHFRSRYEENAYNESVLTRAICALEKEAKQQGSIITFELTGYDIGGYYCAGITAKWPVK